MAQDDSFGLTFGGSLLGGERLVLHWQMPEEVITEERRVGFLQFWDVLGRLCHLVAQILQINGLLTKIWIVRCLTPISQSAKANSGGAWPWNNGGSWSSPVPSGSQC